MKMQSLKRGLQRGFTLVELAIVLVIAGIILVAVLKGTDAINKAKVERAVSDLKGLQGIILEYQKRTGRLPGDCNNNGIIGLAPELGITATATNWDSTQTNRNLPATAVATGATGNCNLPATAETELNLLWNDLRRNNIVDPQRLPSELAKNMNGSFYSVGYIQGATSTDVANVIVVYAIPIWMAEAIDSAIDGETLYAGGLVAGNTGRVRRWDGNVTGAGNPVFATATFTNGYAKTGETRDTVISIFYMFDTNKLPN